jgi:mannose-1-phosphate guanylyltransferase/phosphomannomutase
MTADMQKEVEKHFTRGELRRVAASEVASISYPARVRESYANDLLETLDTAAIRARGFRLVVDYGFSASSYVLPLVLGPLGVEAVAAHAFPSEGDGGPAGGLAASIGQAKRLVPAVGADLGAVFDRAGERLYLIDEQAKEIPVEQALLLYLSLIAGSGRTGKLAFPVTVTSHVDRLIEGTELEIVRTRASLPELTKAAVEDGVVFGGAVGGGYVFPDFLPAYDAVASLAKLLELLATVDRPISALVAELPEPTLIHRQMPCPWALKGLIMRVLNERMAGRDVDLTDGIKVFSDRGWAQVLPDPDEPLVHLYAEGETTEESEELAGELRVVIEEIEQGEAAAARM